MDRKPHEAQVRTVVAAAQRESLQAAAVRPRPRQERPYTDKKHISVPVKRPLNRRQTTAFVGDWVLKANKGFKVYTDKAFKENFELPADTPKENNPKDDNA